MQTEFKCQRKGADCCKNLMDLNERKAGEARMGSLKHIPFEEFGLPLFGWETEDLRNAATQRGLNVKLQPEIFARGANGEKVVIIWSLSHDVCPFLTSNDDCSIYPKRPLICQSFPIIAIGLDDYLAGKRRIDTRISRKCGCCPVPEVPNTGLGRALNHMKSLNSTFPDQFSAAWQIEMIRYAVQGLVSTLCHSGLLTFDDPNPAARVVDIFDYAADKRILPDKKGLIEQIKKDAEEFSTELKSEP